MDVSKLRISERSSWVKVGPKSSDWCLWKTKEGAFDSETHRGGAL